MTGRDLGPGIWRKGAASDVDLDLLLLTDFGTRNAGFCSLFLFLCLLVIQVTKMPRRPSSSAVITPDNIVVSLLHGPVVD